MDADGNIVGVELLDVDRHITNPLEMIYQLNAGDMEVGDLGTFNFEPSETETNTV